MRDIVPFLLLLAVTGCSASNPSGPPSEEERARAEACARLSGCLDFEGEFTTSAGGFASCISALDDLALDAESVSACVLDAEDCAGAAACLNAGEAPEACDPASFPRGCDGEVARTCRGGVTVGQDCAASGLSCVQDAAGQVFCGQPGACSESVCEGNTLVACLNGARYVRDCGVEVCQVAPELGGNAACAGEGAPCEGRIFECDGDVAVTCQFGRIHRETCGPGLCSTSDGAFCMSSPDCRSLPRCEGNELVHCVGGVPSRIDCARFGFSCSETADAVRCE